MIRARAVSTTGHSIRELQQKLHAGFTCTLESGETVQLELVRSKNKFRTLEPTHFRNILNNIRVRCGTKHVFAELQVHHESILEYNDNSGAHEHYEYFRSKLKSTYEDELERQIDFILETMMDIFAVVVKVPVLLSMLAVVLGDQGDEASLALPTHIYQLYQMAIDIVLEASKRNDTTTVASFHATDGRAARMSRLVESARIGMAVRLAAHKLMRGISRPHSELTIEPAHARNSTVTDLDIRRCLRQIAYQNHLKRRRVFTSAEALECLRDDPELLSIWNELARRDSPPLLKILTAASHETGAGGEYQFSHLSFQEFFFLETLSSSARACHQDSRGTRSATRSRSFVRSSTTTSPASAPKSWRRSSFRPTTG